MRFVPVAALAGAEETGHVTSRRWLVLVRGGSVVTPTDTPHLRSRVGQIWLMDFEDLK